MSISFEILFWLILEFKRSANFVVVILKVFKSGVLYLFSSNSSDFVVAGLTVMKCVI